MSEPSKPQVEESKPKATPRKKKEEKKGPVVDMDKFLHHIARIATNGVAITGFSSAIKIVQESVVMPNGKHPSPQEAAEMVKSKIQM